MSVPQFQFLAASLTDGVFKVALNRPDRFNAFNQELYQDIIKALEWADNSDDVVVMVITGNGKYYSSGNDLSNFLKVDIRNPKAIAALLDASKDLLLRFVNAFIRFKKPLIAAVNGPAIGIAVTTLALCDYVYAAASATFHTPFMQLAQSPEGCSSLLFPEIMGASKANEMLVQGKIFTAQEALESRLLNAVFPDNELASRVDKIAADLAKYPIGSLLAAKQLIRNEERIALLERVNKREVEVLGERWMSAECMQAIMNFMKRRRSRSKM